MKKFKIIIFIFICTLTCAIFASCADLQKETINLIYMNYAEAITIRDLTDTGKKLEQLIIPRMINGKPVTKIGEATMGYTYQLRSKNLKSLNLPASVSSCYLRELENLDTLILNSIIPKKYIGMPSDNFCKPNDICIYVPSKFVKHYMDVQESYKYKFYSANISYMYNYDGSPNGDYFFVDYKEMPCVITIDEIPMRQGYDFSGWYTDPECTVKFDFAQTISSEVILYAGWIK